MTMGQEERLGLARKQTIEARLQDVERLLVSGRRTINQQGRALEAMAAALTETRQRLHETQTVVMYRLLPWWKRWLIALNTWLARKNAELAMDGESEPGQNQQADEHPIYADLCRCPCHDPASTVEITGLHQCCRVCDRCNQSITVERYEEHSPRCEELFSGASMAQPAGVQ